MQSLSSSSPTSDGWRCEEGCSSGGGGGGAKVVQRMKNCCSAYAHRSYIESSSYAPWTISAVTTATYLPRGTHITLYTFNRPPQVAFALTYLVYGPDHGWTPDRS